jgi:rhodanese-related sulfurtransferase
MSKHIPIFAALFVIFSALTAFSAKSPTTQPGVGEQIPSEDPLLADFHSLGLINGHTNIFRAACPVRDLAKLKPSATQPAEAIMSDAVKRMQRLYDLGIRTDISFQTPAAADEEHPREVARAIELEKAAAAKVGITYVAMPMANSGKNSFQDMSDKAVLDWLNQVSTAIFQSADHGGVVFHCSAGHDRAGIVAAFLRMKYEHWSVDEAIAEMRRLGHNWPKFSTDGGLSSWHEAHLRAIARMIPQ